MVQRSVQSRINSAVAGALALMVYGCATLEDRSVASPPGVTSRPAPVDTARPEPRPVPDVALARPQSLPPASSKQSVSVLLGTAQRQQASGDFDAAVATLERAVRIDARNAQAWHQLANLRYQQKNWEQAAQLALKSNSFAGADKALQVRNWRLIADAKNSQGDNHAAETARQRASELESQW